MHAGQPVAFESGLSLQMGQHFPSAIRDKGKSAGAPQEPSLSILGMSPRQSFAADARLHLSKTAQCDG